MMRMLHRTLPTRHAMPCAQSPRRGVRAAVAGSAAPTIMAPAGWVSMHTLYRRARVCACVRVCMCVVPTSYSARRSMGTQSGYRTGARREYPTRTVRGSPRVLLRAFSCACARRHCKAPLRAHVCSRSHLRRKRTQHQRVPGGLLQDHDGRRLRGRGRVPRVLVLRQFDVPFVPQRVLLRTHRGPPQPRPGRRRGVVALAAVPNQRCAAQTAPAPTYGSPVGYPLSTSEYPSALPVAVPNHRCAAQTAPWEG